jgi:hypothetical protein
MKKFILVSALMLNVVFVWGQTIFTENMFNGTGGANGDAISVHESNNRFNEDALTYSGTGDLRNNTSSIGYSGASGTWNTMLNASTETFVIDGITASTCSNLTLSFGVRKATTASNGSTLNVEYSTTGTAGPFTTIAWPLLPTGAGTAVWALVSSTSIIPNTVTTIRFRTTDGTEFRIDDVILSGTCVSSTTITTSPLSTSSFTVNCSTPATGTVDFTSTGTFTAGNIYTAQLSNASGSFAAPTSIGTLNSTSNSGTINITIPAGTATGAGYRIRVISSAPVTTGTDNGSNISITLNPCTITTGVVSGGPFAVDCSTSDAGSVAFTSSGTFAVGNTFTVQLSSAAGSFASPTTIGTLTGATAEGINPSGSINFTIPSATASGAGYLIRIISSNPSVTGSSSTANTVTLSGGPCTLEPPRLSSVIINSCDGLCTEGNNELVFGTSGDYAFTVNTTNFDFLYGSTFPGTNYTDVLVNNAPTINLLNTAAGCGTLFIDATGTTVPANSNWMLASTALCDEALTWNGLCGSGPIYVIFQNDANWNAGGNFANNPSSPGTRYYRTNITTTVGTTFTIDYTTDGSYPDSDGVFATFDSDGGASISYGDNDCILNPVLLPSELVSFYGMNNHEINSIYWQTASEQNNDYFTLSHSTDGYNFTQLAQLNGAGNSDQTLSYSFDHTRPASGINYYKLSSTDFDGSTYLKGIIAVNTKSNLSFYNVITSSIELSSKSSIALYSLEGRLILTAEKTSHIPFNESGVYLLVNQLTGETERIFIPE